MAVLCALVPAACTLTLFLGYAYTFPGMQLVGAFEVWLVFGLLVFTLLPFLVALFIAQSLKKRRLQQSGS